MTEFKLDKIFNLSEYVNLCRIWFQTKRNDFDIKNNNNKRKLLIQIIQMEIFERNGGTKRMKMKKNSLQNSNSVSWVIGKYIDNVHINAEWKVLHENSPSPLSIHRKTYYLCCEKISTFSELLHSSNIFHTNWMNWYLPALLSNP